VREKNGGKRSSIVRDETTNAVLAVHAGRMVGDGVHSVDLEEIISQIEKWDDWYSAWAGMGDRYETLAGRALDEGRRVTAGEFYWQASICYQYAQFLFVHRRELREQGQRKKESLYRRSAPLLVPPAERFEVVLDGVKIPGFLRLPDAQGPFPTAVLLGGLESTKEESYQFENMLLKRGVATCTFDGPGQGEMFFDVPLQHDFERYTTAVVDWLATRPEIDTRRLGVLGRSLGGYYAIRSAAADHRFKACVAWGAVYELSVWDRLPQLTRSVFCYVSGIEQQEEAKRYLIDAIDLSSVIEGLGAALLVVHGALDDVWPPSQAERIHDEATNASARELWIEPNGNHCCHNLYPIVRPAMADWLTAHL
jgi:2,6-dihydroxypseudooxynicotine hydrolase